MCEIPLTPEQRIFAAENHGLVRKFLKENHLPTDDFYDVVIFGYLRAVHRFFEEPKLQKYSFATIAWNCMRVDLINFNKACNRQKRTAETISIHIGLTEEDIPLEESIPATDDLMLQLEMKLLLHDLAARLSKQQMDMVYLKRNGYGIRDIARSQKVSLRRAKELLEEVRIILLELCNE